MITCAGFYWYYWLRLIQSPLPATASLIDACLKKKRPIFIGCFFGTFQTGICQSLIDSVMLGLNPSIFALQKGIDKDHTGMPARNRQLFMTKNGKAFARKWLGNDKKWQKYKSGYHKLTLSNNYSKFVYL